MAARVASIAGGDLCKILEIKTLGGARDDEARRILQRAALQVQPIMRKRRWRVLLLREFSPKNDHLLGLNVNHGQEVKIRLRKYGRESEFFPYEHIVGTLLHELTHNEHGPHDAKFYKLLDEITKECEELMAKGITGTGEGFDGASKRLGGHLHNPSGLDVRKAALAAAEKRLQIGSLMPSGPHRLGGNNEIMKSLSPVQAAAMAADRRLRDDLWCAAPYTTDNDGEDVARTRENQTPSQASAAASNNQNSQRQRTATTTSGSNSNSNSNSNSSSSSSCDDMWECDVCTLLNPPLAPICGACGGENVKIKGERESNVWVCTHCTVDNPKLVDKCAVCNQWRYSYSY